MEFTLLELILQWLASAVVFGSTFLRSWTKNHMFESSVCSFIGGMLFAVYSFLTGQWGLLPLNIYTMLMGLRAMRVWRKKK